MTLDHLRKLAHGAQPSYKPLNKHGLNTLAILLASADGDPALGNYLQTINPDTILSLINLVERANRAFVPALQNADSMTGMEAREWADDFKKLNE